MSGWLSVVSLLPLAGPARLWHPVCPSNWDTTNKQADCRLACGQSTCLWFQTALCLNFLPGGVVSAAYARTRLLLRFEPGGGLTKVVCVGQWQPEPKGQWLCGCMAWPAYGVGGCGVREWLDSMHARLLRLCACVPFVTAPGQTACQVTFSAWSRPALG